MARLDELDPRLRAAIAAVKGRRPRRVVEHILEHGRVTTEDLLRMGYKHAPRAARDVRECGVPLDTTRVTGPDGKSIAAYAFGDPSKVVAGKLGGRQVFPKELKQRLVEQQGGRCAVCNHAYEQRYLQVDHRVPYEIAGEGVDAREPQHFMALCGSCQRKKSWSCEHCDNWNAKAAEVCRACYWADPLNYTHIAMENVRQLTLTFGGVEAAQFDRLRSAIGADALVEFVRHAILSVAPSAGAGD